MATLRSAAAAAGHAGFAANRICKKNSGRGAFSRRTPEADIQHFIRSLFVATRGTSLGRLGGRLLGLRLRFLG